MDWKQIHNFHFKISKKRIDRTKAKEYHPDRNPGKDTTVEMQKINAAKEYLDANLEYYLSKKFQN